MNSESVLLTQKHVSFLMSRFNTEDPEQAIDLFIEFLVMQRKDPMQMINYINKLMAKENN